MRFEGITCLGCGCLCDDIAVTVETGRIVEARQACALGQAWFEAAEAMVEGPMATIDGRAVSIEEGVARAAEVLRGARAPVVFGLTTTATEGVREALALADRLGARVILGRSGSDLGRVAALQEDGRVGATLGEVKNRADVVVYWGCDPSRTHPRHAERYALEPRGRFVPDGRAGRFMIAVGDPDTATAQEADLVVPLPADRDVELFDALRLRVRHRVTGAGWDFPHELVGRLTGARYGALFYQSRELSAGGTRRGWEAASRLVRALNEVTRFVLLGLGASGNRAGAESVLTWQGGFPQGVDFGSGVPTPIDEAATLDEILTARETDAVLIVADPFPDGLTEQARALLEQIPTVLIAPDATRRAPGRPTVALTSATTGIDVAGTVTRVDGVALPLRPLRDARFPTDREWLRQLADRVGDRG